jgi:ABC-type bacteriocin/lantibiotic exporter with double-glycine peptidase domain
MQALALVSGAAALFYLNWPLALLCLVMLPFLFASTRFFMGRSRILGHTVMERGALVDSRLQESLSASTLIKSFASEEEEAGKLREDLDRTREASIESSVFNSLAGLSITSLGSLAGLIVLGLGGYLVIKGEWTLGSLLAFQSYLAYVLTPARELSYSFVTLQGSLAALERVSDLMLMVPEEEEGKGMKAPEAAGIREFIESLPHGYGTKVEELGKNLSEGQKQRISIARALLKKPDIVILDEPTSALDSVTEKSIVEMLPGALHARTLIIVAHRLATARIADVVLVLHGGELVDQGSHDELLGRCALYRAMVESQGLLA